VEIKEDAGTSNITAADGNGLVVSITTTVGLNWGSKIIVPGYGFVLNDSMDDFSVKGRRNGTGYEPTEANYGKQAQPWVGLFTDTEVQAGKRPLSSSCPYIVENSEGHVIVAGGAAGGSTIISGNVQVIRNILVSDLSDPISYADRKA
jgi:gamma-glutamyltranspeptidase/glutathione hydrolase